MTTVQGAAGEITYNDRFDPATYLRARYGENVPLYRKEYPLGQFHDFFRNNCLTGLKVLDYGCGPTLLYSISAAAHASELVLADYTEKSRQALQLWMSKDPKAFDWSLYFDYVVQTLEGGTEAQAREREERMRKVVKAVVPCNIFEEKPIEQGYEGPYDVISSCFCLEGCITTVEEYAAGIKRLSSLLKPGGRLVIYTSERENIGKVGDWKVGEHVFHVLAINGDFIKTTLEQSGFSSVTVKHFKANVHVAYSDTPGTMFVIATKAD